MAKKQIALAFLIFTVVVGLVSMILSITAYSKWKQNADEYQRILNNWKTVPIVNMSTVYTYDSCPTGWETLGFGEIDYQIARCNIDGVDYDFQCEVQTVANAGNGTDRWDTFATYALGTWKNSKVCVKRAGTNAIDRPLESKDGYRSCGTNPDTGAFYFDTDQPCPITYISDSPPTSGTYATYSLGGSGSMLYASRDQTIGRPFLEFTTGEGIPCKTSYSNFNGLTRTTNTPIGRNQTGTAFSYTGNGNTVNPYRTGHPGASSCSSDYRFSAIDTQTEFGLYNDNLQTANGTVPLGSYVYADDSAGINNTFWNRPEILWKEDCEYTREEVNKVKKQIDVVTACTLAVMIITIIAALFDCVTEGYNYKNQIDDDPNNDDEMAVYQKSGNLFCTVGLMITTIVTFVFVSMAKSFFSAMRDGNCSDSQTNNAIGYVAKTAIELVDIWAGKLTLDSLKCLYYIYGIYSVTCGKDKGGDNVGDAEL